MRRSAPLALLALSLMLTGCGPDVEKNAEYANAWQVRQALLEAGHDCPGEHQVDHGTDAEDIEFTLKCDSDLSLETVTDEYAEGLEGKIATLHALTKLPNTLHGPNWVITSKDMDRLVAIQENLGGKITAG